MTSRVVTKAAALRLNEVPPVEVVVFNDRRPKGTKETEDGALTEESLNSLKGASSDFNLKKARFEVTKLAMSSLKSTSKMKAKEALAISLGARPGKRRGVNYRDLKTQREAEKEAEEHDEKMRSLGKILKKTGRKTATGRTMGSAATPNKSQKGTPKAPTKLKSGILGKYGKVDKAKLNKYLKTQTAASLSTGKPGKPKNKKFQKSKR
ncbi:uncharacterized protein C1orf131 [Cloeon dipterum]|uniref:uncharacterized protein C1orf131 n=1 Tax=Cloeon dipterum TaxID=197152 RepID=UPI00322090FF